MRLVPNQALILQERKELTIQAYDHESLEAFVHPAESIHDVQITFE